MKKILISMLILMMGFAAPATSNASIKTKTTTIQASKPNVLVFLDDDQGCDQHTTGICDTTLAAMKFLASQPGGNWYNFTQTRYFGSLCCPDRASILTGQTNWHNKQYGNSQLTFNESETLATAFHRNGYSTGLFGKYVNPYSIPNTPQGYIPPGWDRWVAQKGDTESYWNYTIFDNIFTGNNATQSYTVAKNGDSTYDAYWLGDKLMQFTSEQNNAGNPWLAYFAPHGPHGSAVGTSDVVKSDYTPLPAQLPNLNEGCPGAVDPDISDQPSFMQTTNCGSITGRQSQAVGKAEASLDHEFKKLWDNLVATGQVDNTIILFAGDNGMLFGSHSDSGKECAYEECATNPLMMRVPGKPGGTIDRIVSNVDFMPTLLDLTGGSTTLAEDGKSFVQLLDGNTVGWRNEYFMANGPSNSKQKDDFRTIRDDCVVTTPCYMYTQYQNGEEMLFDLTSDPFELHQLLKNPKTGYLGDPAWRDTQFGPNSFQYFMLKYRLNQHVIIGN